RGGFRQAAGDDRDEAVEAVGGAGDGDRPGAGAERHAGVGGVLHRRLGQVHRRPVAVGQVVRDVDGVDRARLGGTEQQPVGRGGAVVDDGGTDVAAGGIDGGGQALKRVVGRVDG